MKPRVSCAMLIAAALTVAACESPLLPGETPAELYDFRLGPQKYVLRWPSGSRVRVFVNPGPDAQLNARLTSSLAAGAAEWNSYALFGEYEIVQAESLQEADVVLRWSNDPLPVNAEECPPDISNGVTTFCLVDPDAAELRLRPFPLLPPAEPDDSQVRMVITILSSQANLAGRVETLVAHELGHMLGIGLHSPRADDLMAAAPPARATLSQRDAATLEVLYHTRADITP